MTRAPGWHQWTQAETKRLFRLRDKQKLGWPKIAAIIGFDLGHNAAAKCAARYHAHYIRKRGEVRPLNIAPNSALIERDRRLDARAQQDLTGAVFGDPPRGFSALDRRRSA